MVHRIKPVPKVARRGIGEKEVALAREQLGWKYPPFEIPKKFIRAGMRGRAARKQNMRGMKIRRLPAAISRTGGRLKRRMEGELG